jgi:hypothetical protein
MFGRDSLVDDGARVVGVIIEAPEYFRGSTDVRGRYKVTVRVRFDDGATVEVERRLHLSCSEHRHLVCDRSGSLRCWRASRRKTPRGTRGRRVHV